MSTRDARDGVIIHGYEFYKVMIYRRAHIADCARHMGAVFPLTLAIGGLIFLSRLLPDTVANALPPSSVWQFLALAMIKYLPQLLVVSLFAGMLLSVERAFHCREMAAWFSAGIGMRHFVLPGVAFALPTIIIIAALSCAISPWSVRAADALRAQLMHDIHPQNLRVGEFGTAPGGTYTYFLNEEGGQNHVFIAREGEGGHEIVSAETISRHGEELMTLEHGAMYLLPDAENASEVISFKRMEVYLPVPPHDAATRPRGLAFTDLKWQTPSGRAEIIWRINQPLAALFFALLVPLLGGSFARGGQRHGFLAAVLLFIAHLNLLYFARDKMAADDLHFIPAMLIAPLAATLAALLLRRRPTGR